MAVEINSLDDLFESLNKLDVSDVKEFHDRPTKATVESNEIEIDEISKRFLNLSNVLDWNLLDLLQSMPDMNTSNEIKPNAVKNNNTVYSSFLHCPDPVSRTSYHFHRLGIDGKICLLYTSRCV